MEGLEKTLVVRLVALATLVAICIIVVLELSAVRGALAYKRFDLTRRAAGKAQDPEYFHSQVKLAVSDAESLLATGEGTPPQLTELSAACLRWAADRRLRNTQLKLRLAERSIALAAQAVQKAPSDYYAWERLARAQLALGLMADAKKSLDRSRELATEGKKPEIPFLGATRRWKR